ncbi:hypothetical protein B0H21DRAFT_766763 [Amylocystis lapponica]|nr:hypothetical protein B0H21DRAFT_766763 [Amylocystis lapponica]
MRGLSVGAASAAHAPQAAAVPSRSADVWGEGSRARSSTVASYMEAVRVREPVWARAELPPPVPPLGEEEFPALVDGPRKVWRPSGQWRHGAEASVSGSRARSSTVASYVAHAPQAAAVPYYSEDAWGEGSRARSSTVASYMKAVRVREPVRARAQLPPRARAVPVPPLGEEDFPALVDGPGKVLRPSGWWRHGADAVKL